MDLLSALALIKSKLDDIIIESKHFKDKCEERNLELDKIRELIKTNKILGILEQNKNQYKVWFNYEKNKDLNIIISITMLKELKFITIFPSDVKRRQRE